MRRYFIAFILAAAALGLAACNSGGNTNPPAPQATCSPPAGTQSALVYPAPNATGVPDQFGQIVIGSSPALPASWDVVVVTAISPNGLAGGTLTAAAQPLPTPNATPSFANPQYQSSSFGSAIFPGEVVQVFLNKTNSSCVPLGPIGSFTTQ